ncbi:CPCC family cysteine-rich protein [Clostridium sp.]|uniref:CPCC family cysteine-rich protein n=1 Tax=Clostridium sp. TaxID=1506 RepID=UPI00321724B4
MKSYSKYCCPCCGFYTFKEPLEGYYDVCDVCFWLDDLKQNKDHLLTAGVNDVCLDSTVKNYLNIGAVDIEKVKYTRRPYEDEIPEWIIVINKNDYDIFVKYLCKSEINFIVDSNIFKFYNKGNLLLHPRNESDLVTYDLVCDLYTKVGIDKNDEPTWLGYKIESISDYIYSCMLDIERFKIHIIIQKYNKFLMFQ